MSYKNTFIQISADCPVEKSEIPTEKNGKKPQHLLQYELLTNNPYRYNHEELIWEVYTRHKEISKNVLKEEGEKIKAALFSKGHPCLRASALTKRYGFGAHYNEKGKIAIYPMESKDYKKFVADKLLAHTSGMNTKRAAR